MCLKPLAVFAENATVDEAVFFAEGTVMHHLSSKMKLGHPIVKDVMKLLRSCTQLPEHSLRPFTLFLALVTSSVKAQTVAVTESLKATLVKNIAFAIRREEDAWFASVTQPFPDPGKLIGKLIEQSTRYGGWHLIVTGLIAMAFMTFSPWLPLRSSSCTFWQL